MPEAERSKGPSSGVNRRAVVRHDFERAGDYDLGCKKVDQATAGSCRGYKTQGAFAEPL